MKKTPSSNIAFVKERLNSVKAYLVQKFPFLKSFVLGLAMNFSGNSMPELAEGECDITPGKKVGHSREGKIEGEVTEYIKVTFLDNGRRYTVQIPMYDELRDRIRVGGGTQRFTLEELGLNKGYLLNSSAY